MIWIKALIVDNFDRKAEYIAISFEIGLQALVSAHFKSNAYNIVVDVIA